MIEEEIAQYEQHVDFFITFTYIKSPKPFVKLNNVIKEKDIHKLGMFINDYKNAEIQQAQHVLPECHNILPRLSYHAILEHIYHDLVKKGCITFHQQEFLKRFALQKVFSNHRILIVFYDSSIGYEILLYYHLKEGFFCDGLLITEIRVLCIREIDDYQLHRIMDENEGMCVSQPHVINKT